MKSIRSTLSLKIYHKSLKLLWSNTLTCESRTYHTFTFFNSCQLVKGLFFLQVLHEIQTVVQQCPPLAKLQHDLEEISFQSASAMPIVTPPDYNTNAALMQAVTNLEITAPAINSTA